MLADTVEAASRTLQKPTPQRIRGFVDTLIDKKVEEEQLNESHLTLKEIDQIKEAFIPILMGIHHVRIEYPSGEETPGDKRPTKELAEIDAATNGKNKKELMEKEKNKAENPQKKPNDPSENS